jgi:hypothetical protein
VNLVKIGLVILMDPEVCEGLQRVYGYERMGRCIEGIGFAWVVAIDTPVGNVGQGSLV